jgi:tetratricopeptide (TPR) repeat protein
MLRRFHRPLVVALGLVLPLVASGRPARPERGVVAEVDDGTLWARASRGPAGRTYRAAMLVGDRQSRRASELAIEAERNGAAREFRGEVQAAVLRAVEAYEKAVKAEPRAGEPHYRAAEVLWAHFVDNEKHPTAAPTRRAIAHWVEFERLRPKDPRLSNLYFRRSLAYTKLGGEDNFRLAVEDYERQLGLTDAGSARPEDLATVNANAAELHMGVGDLDRAITLYRDALELRDTPLHGFGLAVALDRDGQGVKAREVMRSYLEVDRKMEALFDKTVFFVPEGEIHYYVALGHEVLGQLDSAANNYRQFLRLLPKSRWADRARANLRAVEKRSPRRGSRTLAEEVDL